MSTSRQLKPVTISDKLMHTHQTRAAFLIFLCIFSFAGIGCEEHDKGKADHDFAYCQSHALNLGVAAHLFKQEHGDYPKSFALLLDYSNLSRGLTLPTSGRYIDFEYGVESGHEFLISARQSVSGKWVVVYPDIVIKRESTSPF